MPEAVNERESRLEKCTLCRSPGRMDAMNEQGFSIQAHAHNAQTFQRKLPSLGRDLRFRTILFMT